MESALGSALKNRIVEDMKAAMRAKQQTKLDAIRMLLAAIKQQEVDKRLVLDDVAVVAIVDKLIKSRKDSIVAFAAAKRQDLVDKETEELHVIEAYLPARMDEAAVSAEVDAAYKTVQSELGRSPLASDMGRLMTLLKASLAGKADMALVSRLLKNRLN